MRALASTSPTGTAWRISEAIRAIIISGRGSHRSSVPPRM
jgi:hypothetical protein